MVTSGKSPSSAPRTCPIVNRGAVCSSVSRSALSLGWGTAVTAPVLARPTPRRPDEGSTAPVRSLRTLDWPTRSCAGRLTRPRPGQVHQAELADLHLVATGEGGDVDRLAVDVGAVQAADVVHGEAAALAVELHVPPADGDVVQEDVAVGVPAGGGDLLVEQEAAAGVGAALDHQQRRPGGEGLDSAGVGVRGRLADLSLLARVLATDLGDDAGRLADPLGAQSRTALGAESAALAVLVATSSAEHVGLLRCRRPRRGPVVRPRSAGGRRAGRPVAGRPPRGRGRAGGHGTSG